MNYAQFNACYMYNTRCTPTRLVKVKLSYFDWIGISDLLLDFLVEVGLRYPLLN